MDKTLKKELLIFDFDGTLCNLLKNYDMKKVTEDLNKLLKKKYNIDFPLDEDAFHVFDFIYKSKLNSEDENEALSIADDIISEVEILALDSAERIDGVSNMLKNLHDFGYKIVIATNNNPKCVEKFLGECNLDFNIPIYGRIKGKENLMKPNPSVILRALNDYNISSKDAFDAAVKIGDNPRDYIAATSAECDFIGLALLKRKEDRFLKILDKSKIFTNIQDLYTYFTK